MKNLEPPQQFNSKGVESSPAEDQPKLKDAIQKIVEFGIALVITIAKVDRLTTHGATQVITPITMGCSVNIT